MHLYYALTIITLIDEFILVYDNAILMTVNECTSIVKANRLQIELGNVRSLDPKNYFLCCTYCIFLEHNIYYKLLFI